MKFKLFFLMTLLLPLMNNCMEKRWESQNGRQFKMEGTMEMAVHNVPKKNVFKMTGILLTYNDFKALEICNKCIDTVVLHTVITVNDKEIPFGSISRINFREKNNKNAVVKIYDDKVPLTPDIRKIQSQFETKLSNDITVRKIAKCSFNGSTQKSSVKNVQMQFVDNKTQMKLTYLLYNRPEEIILKKTHLDFQPDAEIIH